jgi:AAA+ ATPase superfamily predicted ATPase
MIEMFVNRKNEISRLRRALANEKSQFIVVYGRRRCGKSTLLREVLAQNSVYFAADLREKKLQIGALANQIEKIIPGFGKPVYLDWESLLLTFNRSLQKPTTLCIDEFPYLVKNSPELPSVFQRIIDEKSHQNFNLIICGSSQQMMYNMALDSSSPLYGRSDEIIRVKPMNIHHLREYLQITSLEVVAEFGIWGGIPRYWEIRNQNKNLEDAVRNNLLDQNGLLYEEPERLFIDEMRTSVQAFSVLSLIGAGCHRISEIAARLGKPVTQFSRLLGFLTDLGYIRREIPFGESIKSTKKSLYKIDDSFLNFYFTFLVPNKSRLEFGLADLVWNDIKNQFDNYLSAIWEDLCRKSVPFLEIDGKRFNPAARWWGTGLNGKPMELDVVAESTDHSVLLVGEVKWTNKLSVDEINASLSQKCLNIPFSKEKKVIKAIFGKVTPVGSHPEIFLFDPDDVVSAFQE